MKRVLALFLAVSMVFTMAACQKEEPKKEDPAAEQETVKEELSKDSEVYIKDVYYPGDVETGIIDTGKIAELFKESDAKYLWYNVNTDVIAEECSLYALGEDAFKARIEDKAIEDEINQYSDTTVRREELSRIEENAVSIFDGYLTRGDGHNYKGYFEAPFTAFDGKVIAGMDFAPDDFLKENGLDLYFRNAEVEQIISSDILVLSQWLVTAKVKVTVDCYENSGIFKGLEWIPAPGMEKDIELAVTYMSYYTKESDLHEVQVYDVVYLGPQ